MQHAVKTENIDPVDIDGLDDVFTSTVDLPIDKGPPSDEKRWSLSDAALTFGVTERTIRRWIKQGRLQAQKVDGPRGPEWRIDPTATDDINIESSTGSPDISPDTRPAMSPDIATGEFLQLIRELHSKLDEANTQLQSAQFRIGFLESEVSTRDTQLRLLTDSQHRSWWRRFCSWFISPGRA